MFQETKEKEAAELGMKNVGGVFLVLAAGLSIACIIACVERYWVARRKRVALKLVGMAWYGHERLANGRAKLDGYCFLMFHPGHDEEGHY